MINHVCPRQGLTQQLPKKAIVVLERTLAIYDNISGAKNATLYLPRIFNHFLHFFGEVSIHKEGKI